MSFLNLGIGEILFIIIIALIIFGPGNMVKTARDAGVFIRKVTKSPYWQEIWATKRELTELPKIIAKEAQIDQTINELNKETKNIKSSLTSTVTELIKEVDQPVTIENPLNVASRNQVSESKAQTIKKPEISIDEKMDNPKSVSNEASDSAVNKSKEE